MKLARKRRHHESLRLSLPPPVPPSLSPRLHSPDSHDLSDFDKLEVIGQGNGGTVYKVIHRPTSSIYALKLLRFLQDAASIRLQALQEVQILERLDSPFIVRYHGVFNQGFAYTDGDGGDLGFLMEYMDGGSLQDVLQARSKLSEAAIAVVARRVLEGLRHVHGMQVVHGDIKPSNLLINLGGEVKIADFGVSRVVGGANETSDSYMGTCAYMSPERFDPERFGGEDSDGFAGDVWSLGVVALECHVGHFPLIGQGQKADWVTLMCAICFGEKATVPDPASSELKSFVGRCLEKEWRKRATVGELLNHPFVNQISSDSMPCLPLHHPLLDAGS